MSLRTEITKLAHNHPELRASLIPLLKEANFARTLGKNHSIWSWEYDHRDREAMLFVGAKGTLELKIIETWEKSGIGAGTRSATLEEGLRVGTVFKPDLGKIKQTLAKHSFERSGAGAPFKKLWTTFDGHEMTLGELISKASETFPKDSQETERLRDHMQDWIRLMDPEKLEEVAKHLNKYGIM